MKLNRTYGWTRLGVVLLMSSALALVGCSSSSDSAGASGGGIKTAADGVMSKGPITGAICKLYKADKTLLATADTTAGAVNFGTLTVSGAVYAECTGGTYKDEATGATVTNTVTMTSAGVVTAGKSFSLAITPLTTMAWNMSGGDPTKTEAAAATVAKAFGLNGVDILSTAPTDLNTKAAGVDNAGRYGTVLASIAQMQKDQNSNLAQVLSDLGNAVNTNGTMTPAVSSLLASAAGNLTNAAKNSNPGVRTNAASTSSTLSTAITAASGTGTSTTAGGTFTPPPVVTKWVTDNAGLLAVLPQAREVFGCGSGFVAVGHSSNHLSNLGGNTIRFATSSNGVTWTALTVSHFTSSSEFQFKFDKTKACFSNKLVFSYSVPSEAGQILTMEQSSEIKKIVALDVSTGAVQVLNASIEAALGASFESEYLRTMPSKGIIGVAYFYRNFDTSKFVTSSNGGATWTASATFPTNAVRVTQAYGGKEQEANNEMLVAVNSDVTAAVSKDGGLTWNATNLDSVLIPIYNYPTLYVYATANGYTAITPYISNPVTGKSNVATSTDGITWTASTNTTLTKANYSDSFWTLAQMGNLFLAQAGTGYVKSTDGGITWSATTPPTSHETPRFMVLNGQFVMIGLDAAKKILIYTSTNGTSWTALTGVTPLPSATTAAAPYPDVDLIRPVSNATGSIAFLFNSPYDND